MLRALLVPSCVTFTLSLTVCSVRQHSEKEFGLGMETSHLDRSPRAVPGSHRARQSALELDSGPHDDERLSSQTGGNGTMRLSPGVA